MAMKKLAVLLGALAVALSTSGATCGGGDDEACVSAKKHMCDKIPDMGCSAAYMDTAQQKIIDACGQAELGAFVPAVQNACSSAELANVPMDCSTISAFEYAAPGTGGTCDGEPMSFSYSGTATADGRSAQLSFTLRGTAVTEGSLYATAVCTSSIHLNSTNVAFTGTLSGSWESPTGSISGSWNGGDYACDGTYLSPDMGYPRSGSLIISMVGGKVQLVRISGKLPYEFSPSGRTYTPPSCQAIAPDASATTTPGGSDASTTSKSDTLSTSSTLGPVCTKLAKCCPTITDLPSLRGQCDTAVENGLGDSGCQIAWNSITRLGYCEGL